MRLISDLERQLAREESLFRTQLLREPLEAFLHAVYAGDESRIAQTWDALHRTRLERLLGCLSTPVPKPDD